MQFIQLAFLVLLAFARRGHAWSVFILDCPVHLFRSELLSAFKGDFSLFYVNCRKNNCKTRGANTAGRSEASLQLPKIERLALPEKSCIPDVEAPPPNSDYRRIYTYSFRFSQHVLTGRACVGSSGYQPGTRSRKDFLRFRA